MPPTPPNRRRPYGGITCEVCGEQCSGTFAMARHMRENHAPGAERQRQEPPQRPGNEGGGGGGGGGNLCEICGDRAISAEGKARHMRYYHFGHVPGQGGGEGVGEGVGLPQGNGNGRPGVGEGPDLFSPGRGPPQAGIRGGVHPFTQAWPPGYTGRGMEPGFAPDSAYMTETALQICSLCDAYFQAFDELWYHFSLFHPEWVEVNGGGGQLLPCALCGWSFSSLEEIVWHMRRVHPFEYSAGGGIVGIVPV